MQRRRQRSQKQWKQILQRQEQSGLSVAQFCRQESLGLSSFYMWRSRLGLSKSVESATLAATSFIDLGQLNDSDPLSVSTAAERWELELNLGNGMTLKFRRS